MAAPAFLRPPAGPPDRPWATASPGQGAALGARGRRRRSGAWAIGPGPGTGRAEYLQFAQSVRMLLEEMEDK